MIIDHGMYRGRDIYFGRFCQSEINREIKERDRMKDPIREVDRTEEYIRKRNLLQGID